MSSRAMGRRGRRVTSCRALTPVEKHGDVWFKREDLFDPFPSIGVSGGKVRQCLELVRANLATIRRHHGGRIATAASVHSPQNVIVAAVARKYGLRCVVGYGGKYAPRDACTHHASLRRCRELGAQLVNLSPLAFSNILYSRLRKWGERTRTRFFTIKFGYEADGGDARNPVVACIARQVQNIPAHIECVAVCVGSGVTAAAVLAGLRRYRPRMKHIVLLQPFGNDRRELIDQYSGALQYRYVKGAHRYESLKACAIDDTLELDKRYEAKSFADLMKLRGINTKRTHTCFWIVGNTNRMV